MDDNALGRLVEALTLEENRVPARTPPFQGYGPPPEWWSYWGLNVVLPNHWRKAHFDDIEYRNPEGKLHRLYGPAYISKAYNIEAWYKDGKRHRIDGPAYIHNKNMVWFQEDKLHRLDGPAVIEGGGPRQYWIDNIRYSAKQYKWEIARRRKRGLIK